jgi:hypothetical protein
MKSRKPSGSIKGRTESLAQPFLNMTVAKLEQPEKEGFLQKNGDKRWFVLKDSRLYYFKNKDAQTPLQGTIELDTATAIDKKDGDKKHGFDVTVHDGKAFQLRAHDEQDKEAWIGAIEKAAAKTPAPAPVAKENDKGTKNRVPPVERRQHWPDFRPLSEIGRPSAKIRSTAPRIICGHFCRSRQI